MCTPCALAWEVRGRRAGAKLERTRSIVERKERLCLCSNEGLSETFFPVPGTWAPSLVECMRAVSERRRSEEGPCQGDRRAGLGEEKTGAEFKRRLHIDTHQEQAMCMLRFIYNANKEQSNNLYE